MSDSDGRSFDGKLQRAEDAEATTGSPTGGAPGTYVDLTTGKVVRPKATGLQGLTAVLLDAVNAPGTINDQGQPVPLTDAAAGYAPSGGPGGFTVDPEDLKTFASRMQSVHDDYFSSGKPVDVTTISSTTQKVSLGPLAEGPTPLLNTYTSFREQVLRVLAELQTLVQSLAVQGNTSSVTYQEVEDSIAQTVRRLSGGGSA